MANLRLGSRSIQPASVSHLWRPIVSLCPRRSFATEAKEATEMASDEDALVEITSTSKMRKSSEMDIPGHKHHTSPVMYFRGPLHPIRPPPPSEPISRAFEPGPFNFPRLKHTYQSTIASDLMTLTYMHKPPGTPKEIIGQRLRSWDGSSPYHKNRPLRAPRGSEVLPLVERNITFRNIPEIRAVTVAIFVPGAQRSNQVLVLARSVMQALTGKIPNITRIKAAVARWHIAAGKPAGVKVTLYGNEAYEFLDKCIHMVFPNIKDWQGLKGSTGDNSGNLAFGLTGEDMALFPEIQANYDMYPAKSIPGCRVFVQTTAKSDRHARLLFQAMGFPFHGRLQN